MQLALERKRVCLAGAGQDALARAALPCGGDYDAGAPLDAPSHFQGACSRTRHSFAIIQSLALIYAS
eukprot:6210099-Pleurochrysis_carterae.AAC.2